jgi:hypothetical protein
MLGGVYGVVPENDAMRMRSRRADHELAVFCREELDILRAVLENGDLAVVDHLGSADASLSNGEPKKSSRQNAA